MEGRVINYLRVRL